MEQEKNDNNEQPSKIPMPEELRKSMNAAVKRAIERIKSGERK
jgi:hypothetical protein